MFVRVLHVLNSNSFSGAENVVISIIQSTKGNIKSAYTSPYGPIKKRLDDLGILYIPMDSSRVTAVNLRKAIKAFNPDIVHAHDFTAGVISCFCCIGIPVINHLHNNCLWLRKPCFRSIAYFFSCFRYKKILTVSDSVMDEFFFGRFVKKKAVSIGNPIDVKKIREKANDADSSTDSSDIVFLGRLSPQKHPLFFLEIISEIVRYKSDIKVAMIGDGELRKQIEEKIREKKIEKNVQLYGFQENPYVFLKNTKILCMPSLWEGYGLAAVEALVLGKPVVASPVGGLKDIITNSCGKLCNKKEDFVAEIISLISDESYYDVKSTGALEKVKEFEMMDVYMKRIEKIYAEVSR